MYQKELNALKRQNRFRQREIFDASLKDFASNDYLGLANSKDQFKEAAKLVLNFDSIAPKSSMLVNGYHPIHKMFEEKIASLSGFESSIVVGSGFLANFALIESLVRKNDMLFIDEEYHASGIAALANIPTRFEKFKHNSIDDLEKKIQKTKAKRVIIAIEGVYSMSGDICKKEFFEIANAYNAILIVDEAHSSGTIGKNLLGVFDYYDIKINKNHIKMGTLGKAYGSYGAYIAASKEIVSFLENRAKPIIYSTAPSIIDIALAYVNLEYIQKNSQRLQIEIAKRIDTVKRFGYNCDSMIVSVSQNSNQEALKHRDFLMQNGFLVGAIRQPTVNEPILRVIPRLEESLEALVSLFDLIAQHNR